MTVQVADQLENDYLGLSFGDWILRAVIRGQPTAANHGLGDGAAVRVDIRPRTRTSRSVEVVRHPRLGGSISEQVEYERPVAEEERERFRYRPDALSSANWRGHIKHYRLTPIGELVLERIEYPANDCAPDILGTTIDGDFYMVLSTRGFLAPSVYIPFRSGRIEMDRSHWLYTARSSSGVEAFLYGCHPDFPFRRDHAPAGLAAGRARKTRK